MASPCISIVDREVGMESVFISEDDHNLNLNAASFIVGDALDSAEEDWQL